jgi:hypothetical protein
VGDGNSRVFSGDLALILQWPLCRVFAGAACACPCIRAVIAGLKFLLKRYFPDNARLEIRRQTAMRSSGRDLGGVLGVYLARRVRSL